jgi:hypothetical protein
VQAEPICALSEHGGVRVRLEASLAFPALLEGPAPRIRTYTRDSVVAEKLHAAVWLGDANTRLKDFYDLFALSASFSFEGPALVAQLPPRSSGVKRHCLKSSH